MDPSSPPPLQWLEDLVTADLWPALETLQAKREENQELLKVYMEKMQELKEAQEELMKVKEWHKLLWEKVLRMLDMDLIKRSRNEDEEDIWEKLTQLNKGNEELTNENGRLEIELEHIKQRLSDQEQKLRSQAQKLAGTEMDVEFIFTMD
ncbi:hypothetical protein D9756_006678 [Leucocoprinus leucothites]|uniref:Uncharacterized protein n=1 Tax=Leucocoprinus leucothites TaxID=201217 RepID=A0A8H5G286_9AGAR|nr:hypothetical protein D9756_006678 [Leucoagaricus leucothites]